VVNRPGSERRWPATPTDPEDLKIQSHCFTRGRLSKGAGFDSDSRPKWYLSPDTQIAENKEESHDGLSSAFPAQTVDNFSSNMPLRSARFACFRPKVRRFAASLLKKRLEI
jgi:hypothetical protein